MKQVGHLSEALPVGRVHRPVPVQAGNQPAPAGSQPVPASHSNQQVLAGFRGSAGDAMRARSRTCQKAKNSVSPTCSRTHMLGTHLRTHLKNEKESVDDEFLFIAGREKIYAQNNAFLEPRHGASSKTRAAPPRRVLPKAMPVQARCSVSSGAAQEVITGLEEPVMDSKCVFSMAEQPVIVEIWTMSGRRFHTWKKLKVGYPPCFDYNCTELRPNSAWNSVNPEQPQKKLFLSLSLYVACVLPLAFSLFCSSLSLSLSLSLPLPPSVSLCIHVEHSHLAADTC
jgi:hypothetical protein